MEQILDITVVRNHLEGDRDSSARLSEDGDSIGISSELSDVLLHPAKCESLILQSSVDRGGSVVLHFVSRKESESLAGSRNQQESKKSGIEEEQREFISSLMSPMRAGGKG